MKLETHIKLVIVLCVFLTALTSAVATYVIFRALEHSQHTACVLHTTK